MLNYRNCDLGVGLSVIHSSEVYRTKIESEYWFLTRIANINKTTLIEHLFVGDLYIVFK
jgi:hypothetical protein